MSVTYKAINDDIRLLVSSLDDDDREVPSSWYSLKLCSLVPLLTIIINVLTSTIVFALANNRRLFDFDNFDYLFSGDAINVYACIVIGVFQILIFLPYVNLYFSVPKKARGGSLVISMVAKKMKLFLCLYLIMIFVGSLIALQNYMWIFSTPAIMVLSIFIVNIFFSLEIAKYGLAPVIVKIHSAVGKL